MKHVGDITKLSGATIQVVDVITGGSPCQDLSIAGTRQGLAGERSGLFMEQVRIVLEMREEDKRNGRANHLARPRYMVWENVPGAFSSNKRQDFRAVLEETIRIAEPDAPDVPMPKSGKWPKAGCLYDELGRWSVAWRVHDAQFWGVPQRRKRIALVADFGGLSAPEILFERKGLSSDSEPGEATGKATAGSAGSGANSASGAIDHPAVEVLPFDTTQVTSPYNRSNLHYGDPCHTLTAGSHPPCVVCAGFRHKSSGMARGIGYEEEIAPTLIAGQESAVVYDARGNGDGRIVPTITGDHGNRVTDYTALCVCNGQLNQISMSEQANTLDTMHDQQTVVRRFTPLECERLQGYPDGWTDIGEWIDSNGKKHRAADSPRCRALANSIALPFWFGLLRRISAQYERPATLGSLFDGIGGFPLCWERCNGTGTALWASEIDEFCVAITKRRFQEDSP